MQEVKGFEVKRANKLLYDRLADDYERVDGRRSEALSLWLRNRLSEFFKGFPAGARLLDLGCGSGFVLKAANGLFAKIYGLDISLSILKRSSACSDGVVNADTDCLPFKDNSVDAVVLFSTLHHLYDYQSVIKEIHRILKKEGILYIDHDMNKAFALRFSLLLWLYRRIFPAKRRYSCLGIDKGLYTLSEFHSQGIDIDAILACLNESGFKVLKNYYHWFGLNKLTDRIFRYREFQRPDAPLACIVARKA